ncbi:UNVERIFIED_CONTAM: hypothetical protein Sradi_2334100 [Sesamum radiatum]|uniref:HAT C-terminal dimerisation domain-containing protein n=1 Tax=Sesamum radiatum TaxID=300843 RepID=A0AAW2T5Q3_SESRA
MEQALKEIVEKKKENRENYITNNLYGSHAIERDHIAEYDDIEEIERQESKEKSAKPSVGKEKARIGQSQSSKIGDFFAPRTTPGSQPPIKSVVAGNDAVKKAHLEVAKFFYDTCIPINACNSRYFQRMFDATLAIGPGYKVLVTCKEFVDSRLARERKTKEVIAIVLNNKFWNDCLIIVKVMEPLMHLLKIVDGDKKLSIGYVYEGIYRARKGIKNLFKNKKRLYKPYTTIIKSRWDRQLREDIHAAAYWFNPVFQYEQASFCQKPEVMNGVLKVITTKEIGSKSKLLHETRLFRDRLESFGQELAFETSKNTQPDEWWKLFGASAPNLQQLAIRILGQTCSSSGCERNWSVFERIHTKKRNKLEHQRLNDLVYVHYNLKLKDRWFMKAESYDPIDYENIADCIEDIEDVEDLEIDDMI